MSRAVLLAPLLLSSACVPGTGRVEVLSKAPSFRARSVAVAGVRGARGNGIEVARAMSAALSASGVRATLLEETDSVLAGSAVELGQAVNPGLVAEIRRATEADAIVFAALDPAWRSLEVSVLDSRSGEPILRATASPVGDVFADAAEAGRAAAEALAELSAIRPAQRPRGEETDEIPVP